MLRFKDEEKALQNSKKSKNTGSFIYEDFCKATMELRKSLWEEGEEVLEQRRPSKIVYLNYRRVVIRDCRYLLFGCVVFFDALRYKMNTNKQNKTEYSPRNFESLKYSLLDGNGDILLDNSCDPDLNQFSKNIKNFRQVAQFS